MNISELTERLEAFHGPPPVSPLTDPMSELVCCILSQHTTDATSFPTFDKLKETFSTWSEMEAAGVEGIVPVIRRAGLPNQKAKSIVGCLKSIHELNGAYSLENLRNLDLLSARSWLTRLPGVGPKTASIVLCFSFGMGAIPVDTHIFRVSRRLGLIPQGMNEAKAHDALMEIVAPEYAFRFHVALICHGRQTCRAPVPACERCPVTDLCAFFKTLRISSQGMDQSEIRMRVKAKLKELK